MAFPRIAVAFTVAGAWQAVGTFRTQLGITLAEIARHCAVNSPVEAGARFGALVALSFSRAQRVTVARIRFDTTSLLFRDI